MADTLININQNQLNTQNGSFIELIKSTQQGKEKLATSLVDKGANVSSSSTLSDMAVAVGNLQVTSGLNPVVGNIIGQTYVLNGGVATGHYIINEYGKFILSFRRFTSESNIVKLRIANVDPYCYTPSSTVSSSIQLRDFTIEQPNYFYSGDEPFYSNEDGTTLFYVGTDKQTIYEYYIDYSNIITRDENNEIIEYSPTNITVTLTNTYTSPTVCANQYNTIVACRKKENSTSTTTDIIIRSSGGNSASPGGGSSNIYYKFTCVEDTITTPSTKTQSTSTLAVPSILQPYSTERPYRLINISSTRLLYIGYGTSYQTVIVDYDNNAILLEHTLAITSSAPTQQFNSGYYCRVQLTPNKTVLAFIIPVYAVDKKNLYSTLCLIDANTGILEKYNSDNYASPAFNDFGNRIVVPTIPTIIGQDVYFSGGFYGEVWKLHINNIVLGTYTVTSSPLLMYGDTYSGNNAVYKQGFCTYDPVNSCIYAFYGDGNNGVATMFYKELLTNQLIAYTYTNNNQTIPLVPSGYDYYNDILSNGALNLPKADVLVEDVK